MAAGQYLALRREAANLCSVFSRIYHQIYPAPILRTAGQFLDFTFLLSLPVAASVSE
jgi:hypothetical protein